MLDPRIQKGAEILTGGEIPKNTVAGKQDVLPKNTVAGEKTPFKIKK